MSFVTSLQILTPIDNLGIERVENKSDRFVKRALVVFKNGYSLSVVCGRGTYGGDSGLFEMTVFDRNDKYCGQQIFPDWSDDVNGWNTLDDVLCHVGVIAKLK